MKRLTLYFLKRWWWVYLIVFVFDFLMFGSGDNDQGQMSYMRVLLSLVCLFVFSKFLLNGGKGAFWLPLTRSQIGRVYWFFMLILPALIYASAEIVGQLLNSGGAVFSIWLPLKHFIFFAGFASSFFALRTARVFILIAILLFNGFAGKFSVWLDIFLQVVGIGLCLIVIRMTFERSEFLIEKDVSVIRGAKFKNSWNLFSISKRSRRTGMAWLIETTFWNVIRNYILIIAILVLLFLLKRVVDIQWESTSIWIPILAIGLFSPLKPIFLMISNLRVSRTLPFTTNQLAGWLIGLSLGTTVMIGLLVIPIVLSVKIPLHSVTPYFLAALEGTVVFQALAIFIAGLGLRSAAAVLFTVMITTAIIAVFVSFGIFSELPLALSILVSIPISFLIHREFLKKGSELYRPSKQRAFEIEG